MKKRLLGLVMVMSLCAGMLAGCNKGTKMNDYSKYVTLGDYTGIEYTAMSTEVTDKELQEQVDAFLQQCGTTEERAEGTVQDGDIINLDYIGYVDGEAFEGGNTEGAGTQLTIGSHQYIDDFEEQLIGHEVGEEGIEVRATFPDNYTNFDGTPSDLAGKEATFVCKINCIYDTVYPEELTDDIVVAYSDYDTVNSFMDALKMDYESYKQELADQNMKTEIITTVIDNATFNGYPEAEVEKIVKLTIEGAKETADSYGMTFEEYVGYLQDENGDPYTPETYEAGADAYIRELMKEKMVICTIAKNEGITVSKADVQAYVETESVELGMSVDAVYETYAMEDLAYAVIYDRVMEYLVENAIAIEE